MSISHTITRQYIPGPSGTTPISGSETLSWGSGPQISELIPSNQTNLAVAFAFTNSKLKAIAMSSDVNMTVKTNDGSSPQETITLVAGIPYIWTLTGSYIGSAASPFGGNVTGLYVTNTTSGTLTVAALVDPT